MLQFWWNFDFKQIKGGEFNGDTIAFCDSWRMSNLTLLNIGTCHLLGHIFKQELQELQFGEILYSAEIKDVEFNGGNCFLWFLMFVNFDLCQYWHLSCFRPQIWMKIGKCILDKSKVLSLMATIVFCSFWRLLVKFDTCQFWHC